MTKLYADDQIDNSSTQVTRLFWVRYGEGYYRLLTLTLLYSN